jgi:cystathionine beta-synthase
LACPGEINEGGIKPYKVEGIGYDFIPRNCDQSVVDKWYKSNDEESFKYARKIIKDEGLLVGGSSGCVLWAALQVAKDLPADKRVVMLFVDSVRNYMTKFLNDDWMLENKFLKQEDYDMKYFSKQKYYGDSDEKKISDLKLTKVTAVKDDWIVKDTLAEMEKLNTECVKIY